MPEVEVLSRECDNGEHYKCKSADCTCVCHDEDLEDPEDDDY